MDKIKAWWGKIPANIRTGLICLLVGLCLGAGVYGVIAGSAVHDLRDRQAAVDANLAELVRQNQESTKRLDSLGAGVAGVQSAVADNAGAIRQLDGSIKSIAGSLGAVVERIGRIEAGQDAVAGRLGELADGLSDFGPQLSGFSSSLGQIDLGIHSATDSLSGTDADINSASEILGHLQKVSPEPKN